ncbi:hypothetical protein EV356DRAFT_501338 [Viridothelium virens]|uniref:MARVEL domain-containing protein n=1 Tax=Viridothelium virens TaxID=1048519 RepID=A0A6A6H9T4_VIRVR|nr:hypothetical protein EV356DRAFT_501338 [Viridothelium virens]
MEATLKTSSTSITTRSSSACAFATRYALHPSPSPFPPPHPISSRTTQRALSSPSQKLKYRIRLLKLLARVLGLLLSLTTLSPLAVTLHKFLSTKDIFRTVDGQSRTAWNAETKLWPMYMYLALAAIATAFNLAIMLAYCWGVRHANRASTVAGWFSGGVYVGHVVVWAVGAALYRAGKDEGEHARDLWGWSCSLGAQKIQDAFAQEVNFGRYCNVQVSRSILCMELVVLRDGHVGEKSQEADDADWQSFSWYSGLAQTGLGFLTAGVYFLAIVRMRSKKHVRKMSTLVEQRYEASRHS